MKIRYALFGLFVLVFVGMLTPEPAYAYIDPGLGSMLLQGLAAGAISVLVFWRSLRRKIISFFKKPTAMDENENNEGN